MRREVQMEEAVERVELAEASSDQDDDDSEESAAKMQSFSRAKESKSAAVEESKSEEVKRGASPISAELPSFATVLSGQHSSGYWASS